MFKKFIRNEEGATAIEYGLIAAGIAVAISAVVFTFGSDLAQLFTDMAAKISGTWSTTQLDRTKPAPHPSGLSLFGFSFQNHAS